MNAHAPPPEKKRAGQVVPTSPNDFGLVDHTPLVCAAQTWCEHANTRIEYLASGPYHAKEVCTDCGQLLRWVAKPETVERQRLNSFWIAKLSMMDGLSNWEGEFLKSIATRPKLSPRQQACLDKIYSERAATTR